MSLIYFTTTALTPTQQTQAATRDRMTNDINTLFGQMLDCYNRNMTSVWSNPDGLQPQQVLDGFNTDAGELFRLAGVLNTAINTTVSGTIPDAIIPTLTFNNNGTVTIGPMPSGS